MSDDLPDARLHRPDAQERKRIQRQVQQGIDLSTRAKTAVAEYFHQYDSAPRDRATARMRESPGDCSGPFVESVEIRFGTVIIRFGNEADPRIAGKTLAVEPYRTSDDSLAWRHGHARRERMQREGAGLITDTPVDADDATTIDAAFLPPRWR